MTTVFSPEKPIAKFFPSQLKFTRHARVSDFKVFKALKIK